MRHLLRLLLLAAIVLLGDTAKFLDLTLMCNEQLLRTKEKQCFKRVPEKTVYVPLHNSVVLPCKVGNKRGKMQWYKQGLGVFGAGPQPYAKDKYDYTGNKKAGEKHLLIRNMTMELEGKYECQVQPGPNILRYKTVVVALVKPSKPRMKVNDLEVSDSQKVHINAKPGTQSFECFTVGGNPPPRFVWYKSGRSVQTTPAGNKAASEKALTAVYRDTLSLMSTSLNGGETVTCSISNEATRLSANGRKSLSISVITVKQRAPGRPEIEILTRQQRYYEGDSFEAVCRARVGVPAGNLLWQQYKADPSKKGHVQYRFDNNMQTLENTLKLGSLNRFDHNSKLTCSATNEMTTTPLEASIKVVVNFAPMKVSIQSDPPSDKTILLPNGEQRLVVYGSVGQTKEMTCITDHYYPTASIFWRKRDTRVTAQKERVIPEAEGNRLQSNVSITFAKEDDGKDLVCTASGIKSQRATTRVRLNIMYPPGRPIIEGHRKKARVGEKMTMRCLSEGGNPPPSLFWYRNNGLERVEGDKERAEGTNMIKDLSFIPSREDNADKYICKSSNAVAGSTEMLSSAPVVINVYFPPERITIRMEGHRTASEGQRVSFVCKSASSNPEATVTWKKVKCGPDHKCISQRLEVVKLSNKPGAYDGIETHSYVAFTVTWEDNGQLVECTATNPEFPNMPVRARTRLNVTYSPKFAPSMARTRTFEEGQTDEVDLRPLANPGIQKHKWLRNIHPFSGNDRITLTQTRMLLQDVNREDMANYTLVVLNRLGETRISFFLNITYQPRMLSPSKTNITARRGKPVELRCRFEANPAPLSGIRWRRLNPATKEVISEASCQGPLNRKAERMRVKCKPVPKKHRAATTLILAPTRDTDTGVYQCLLRNGVGRAARRQFEVLIPSPPSIKMKPLSKIAAADVGGRVNLNCDAHGEPWLTFKWFRGQDNLTLATGKTYHMTTRRLYPGLYRGTLQVSNVKKSDFGEYFCRAINRLGHHTVGVRLMRSRAPDKPRLFRVVNVTETSITLAWSPGFNGGYEQTFLLRYRELEPGEEVGPNDDGRGNYQYVDAKEIPGAEQMQYTVTGLNSGTEYVFSMNARNSHKGAGKRTRPVRMKTRDSQRGGVSTNSAGAKGKPRGRDDTSILIIIAACIFGGLIILVNILVITCILRRKGRCQGSHEQAEYMKADTVELYQHHQPPSITGSSQQGAESVTVSEALLHNYREMHPMAGVQAEFYETGLYPGLPPRLVSSVPNTSPVPNSLPPPSPAQSAVLPTHTYVNVDNIMHSSFPRDPNVYHQYTRHVTLPRDTYLDDAKRVHFSDSLRQRMTTSGIFVSHPRCAPPEPPERTVSNQLSVSQLVIPPPQDFSPPESACESVIERPAATTSSPLRTNQNHNPMTNSITTFAAISTDPDDEGYTSVV